ncbi:MAG TPA: hypothetical protein VF680_17010 [Allosphingosinicella sp.]|jgi:hypothetical protein
MRWIKITQEQPPENQLVKTKVDNGDDAHNEQDLIRKGNLYWEKDEQMYVYYTPTHWLKY